MTAHASTHTAVPTGETRRCVVSIGTFDGVHRGHQALIAKAREVAQANPGGQGGTRVVAMVFKPNPIEVLRPEQAPERLSSFEDRRRWLIEAGADEVVRLEPTHELLGLSPEDFLKRTVAEHHPVAFVEGEDFHFGRARAGDIGVLRKLGDKLGFAVHVVPQVSVALTDHQYVGARSTMVRWLLSGGRVRDAAVVLGRPYTLRGTVVRGDRRGRTIGYPTANMDVSTMIPADGVYACRANLPDGRVLAAALSVGTKPTFGPHARAVEAFILGPNRGATAWAPIQGLEEYGWTLTLDVLGWVREQVKFGSLPGLLEQMERDCERVADIVAGWEQSAGRPDGIRVQEALA